jgi:hypothetical protein
LAGNFLGQGDLGAHAGDFAQKWLGYGDYKLNVNSLITGSAEQHKSSSIPTFSKDGKRGIRLTEREYLGDIRASSTVGAFNNQSFRINPADPITFPWLLIIAFQFEEWEPLGLIFEFVSTSSEFNGTSQALGTVIMATEYDPVDPNFTSKFVMESADYAQSSKASEGARHGVECDMSERPTKVLYTSTAAPTTDIRFNDLGNFQIATAGCSTASVNLGELWVTYDIALYKKQLLGGQVGATIPSVAFSAEFGITSALPLGSLTARFNAGSFDMRFNNSTNVFSFPPNLQTGSFLVLFTADSAAGVDLANTDAIHPLTNCTSLNPLFAGGPTYIVSQESAVTHPIVFGVIINVTGPNATFDIRGVTYSGIPIFSTVVITQVSPETVPWPETPQ